MLNPESVQVDFVSEETHKELKILAAQEGMTLDKYLQLLIKLRLHGD